MLLGMGEPDGWLLLRVLSSQRQNGFVRMSRYLVAVLLFSAIRDDETCRLK